MAMNNNKAKKEQDVFGFKNIGEQEIQHISFPFLVKLYKRESKQPNGCFSLRWTQDITA